MYITMVEHKDRGTWHFKASQSTEIMLWRDETAGRIMLFDLSYYKVSSIRMIGF